MQGARKIYIPECLRILCMKEIKQQPASQPSIPPLVAKLGDDINVYSKGNSQQKKKGISLLPGQIQPQYCQLQNPIPRCRSSPSLLLLSQKKKPKYIHILQQLALAPTKRVGSQAAVSKNPSLPMCVCFSGNNEWLILQVSSSMPQQTKHCNKIHSPLQRTSNFFLLFFLFQPVLLQLERGEKNQIRRSR